MIEAKIYERDAELFAAVRAMPEDQRRLVRIEDIPFTLRSRRVFTRMGLRTLGQLQQKTKFDLLREPGMGKLCYEQAAFFMQELGLPMEAAPLPVSPVVEGPQRIVLEELLEKMKAMSAMLEGVLR